MNKNLDDEIDKCTEKPDKKQPENNQSELEKILKEGMQKYNEALEDLKNR